MEKPAEDPLGNRPGGDQEVSRPNPGERSRNCLPTSGAARRSILSRQQTSRRRQAHRWEKREKERPASLRVGSEEQLALLREEEERLGGEE